MPQPALVLPAVACMFCAGLAAICHAQTTRPSVSVDLSVVADAPKATLAFRVKNTGDAEVVRGELGANTNAIWILCPDGRVDGLSGIIDVFPPPGQEWRPAVIPPGEEVVWDMPVESLLQSIDRPGVFRVYWDFGGTRSPELRLLRRSNRTWSGEPTTRPAPAVRTSATPHAALREFAKALNGEGYQHLYRVTSYPQRDLALTLEEWGKVKLTPEAEAAQALYARGQAAREFTEAVRRRWGDDAVAPEWPFMRADVAGLVAAAAAEGSVTYTDHFLGAVIHPPATPQSVRLVREGRKWMLTMDNCMWKGRTDPAILRTTSVLRSVTKNVADGVYASVDDAREAMRGALAGGGVQPSSRKSAR